MKRANYSVHVTEDEFGVVMSHARPDESAATCIRRLALERARSSNRLEEWGASETAKVEQILESPTEQLDRKLSELIQCRNEALEAIISDIPVTDRRKRRANRRDRGTSIPQNFSKDPRGLD